MARCTAAGIDFESTHEQYVLYNCHRHAHQEQLRKVFRREERPRIILLAGPEGVGKRYLLESCIYQVRQEPASPDLHLVTLDLDGYEPESGSYAAYVEAQLAKRGEERKGFLQELLKYLKLKVRVQPTLAGISAMSIVLELDVPVREIIAWFESAWLSGPKRKPREQLVQFLREFTRDRRLVLHIPERGTELLRTWLVEDLPLLPNILLAFSSSAIERSINDAETDIKPLRVRVEPYRREEMVEFLSEIFAANRLAPELGDALWRATHGYPAFLAIKLCDLISRGTIYRDEDERWCMASEGVVAPDCVEVLETDLYEPIEAVLHRLREEGRGVLAHRAAQFLKIAGLCGSVVPVQLITHYLGFFEDEENELIDSIDEYFIGNVEAPLFQDLAYSHPGFPKFAVYAFANPILQRVLVHRLGIERHKRVEVAARFYRHLREVMPIRSRAVATLYASVLEQTNEESKRQAMESELTWWVGVEEAEALQTHFTQRLKERGLDSETLWLLYERIKNRWPAYRRLALLGAYREQPNGIPWRRTPYWYYDYASTLYELGRYEESRDASREGISRLQESGSSMEGALVTMRGRVEFVLGFLKEAETSFRRALEILEKALGPDHRNVAASLNDLAELYRTQGRYAEAERLHQRALEILEKALGPDHPEVAASLNNLAGLHYAQGRYAEAEPLHQRALGIREKALGPDHRNVATSLNDLAELYRTQGRYAEAEPLHQRALEIVEKALGPDHPHVAVKLNGLARLYDAQGRYAEAEPLYQRALEISEKALGPNHPEVAASLNNLAGLYGAQGRYAEAEPLHQRALEIDRKALDPNHPHVAVTLNNLAGLYYAQGRYAEAEPLLQRALEIVEKALDPNHPEVATSLNNLAGFYYAQGRYAEAEPLYQRALEIKEKALGPDHPDVAISLNHLAALYRTQGRYAEAEPLLQRALGIREKALGPGHRDVAASLNNLAALYDAQGRYAEAEPLHQRALGIREKALGPDHPDVAISLNDLAALYRTQARYAEAEPLHQRALEILEKALGLNHPDVCPVLENYAVLLRKLNRVTEAESMEMRAEAIRMRLAQK